MVDCIQASLVLYKKMTRFELPLPVVALCLLTPLLLIGIALLSFTHLHPDSPNPGQAFSLRIPLGMHVLGFENRTQLIQFVEDLGDSGRFYQKVFEITTALGGVPLIALSLSLMWHTAARAVLPYLLTVFGDLGIWGLMFFSWVENFYIFILMNRGEWMEHRAEIVSWLTPLKWQIIGGYIAAILLLKLVGLVLPTRSVKAKAD